MTTTRLVFAFSNKVMNQNYLQTALARRADGSYKNLGDATKDAKNFTYQTFGDIVNNRKFTLLGDPVLSIAYPRFNIQTDSINGKSIAVTDTLKALQHCAIAGHVTDALGVSQSNFSGTLSVSVFDKEQTQTTLGNDP